MMGLQGSVHVGGVHEMKSVSNVGEGCRMDDGVMQSIHDFAHVIYHPKKLESGCILNRKK